MKRAPLLALALQLGCAGAPDGRPAATPQTRLAGMVVDHVVRPEPVATVPVEPVPVPLSKRTPKTVVLIVLDGIRWQEVFEGVDKSLVVGDARHVRNARALVPNLQKLLRSGGAVIGAPGSGAPISASGPAFISMPGYLEILQGRPAPDCWSNTCPAPDAPTLLGDASKGLGTKLGEVAYFASWPELGRVAARDPTGLVVSAGRHEGTNLDFLQADPELSRLYEKGASSRQTIAHGDYRLDRYTASLASSYLSSVRPKLLFVSLGDADEYGHAGRYDAYLRALHASDQFIGRVWDTLKDLTAQDWPSTLMVTTDHGRDAAANGHGPAIPESARSWLFAWGAGIAASGPVASPEPRHLADIAPTLRVIMGLPPATAPDSGRVLTELVGRGDAD